MKWVTWGPVIHDNSRLQINLGHQKLHEIISRVPNFPFTKFSPLSMQKSIVILQLTNFYYEKKYYQLLENYLKQMFGYNMGITIKSPTVLIDNFRGRFLAWRKVGSA
jgi:hypothetical protein